MTCIREHVTIDKAGRLLEANAERHLKAPQEMARLFRRSPDAIDRTLRFLDHCNFSLGELRRPNIRTRTAKVMPRRRMRWWRSPRKAPSGAIRTGQPKVRDALDHELEVTAELEYAPYFLTVHDIVHFARSKGILCQGRGSAANSVICYCLGITEVDPEKVDLLFERFVSEERKEPPDIDVDFEHERREEVIQYIYNKYGRDHASLTATVICYRGRSAIREVGKVFGLSDDTVGALAGMLWGWSQNGVKEEEARRAGLDPSDPRLNQVMQLAEELIDIPRHLSQHVGGFLITRSRIDEVVPVENAAMEERTVIEWDKDDLETLGCSRSMCWGSACCHACGAASICCASITACTDHGRRGILRRAGRRGRAQPVYRMIQRADTIGVFQIESRAQMSMLPRLQAGEVLRSRHRGRDRAARADPGQDGASLSAAAREIPRDRRGAGLSVALARTRRTGRIEGASCTRRWAFRCSRNRRCASRSSRRNSPRSKRTGCAARWRRSSASARSSTSTTNSSTA